VYYTTVSLSTTGYGDIVPVTDAVPTATANPATTAAAGRRSSASSGERLLGITLATPRRLVPDLYAQPGAPRYAPVLSGVYRCMTEMSGH
jgi:hypothetical protein